MAEEVAGLFGRRIVIVETEGPGAPEFNGFVNSSPELSGYIFIHKGSVRPHLLTVGHELWHHISLSAPNMARTVREALDAEVRNWDAVRKGKDGYSSKEIPDELMGDFLGDSLIEPSFWQRLENRNPVAFSQLAAVVKPVLDRLLERLRASGFKSNGHIKDIERARDVLADAVVRFQEKPFGDSKIGPYEPNDPSATFYSKSQEGKGGAIDEVVERFRRDPKSPDALAFKEWLVREFRDIQDGKRSESAARIQKILEGLEPFRTKNPIYRGVPFRNEALRDEFLDQFSGEVWKNRKPFMSATKRMRVAFDHAGSSAYPVFMSIEGNKSGKDISKIASLLSGYGWQDEILFSEGANFRIIELKKIVVEGKEIYTISLSEVER